MRHHITEVLCHFGICDVQYFEEKTDIFIKQQNGHKSSGWSLIMKMSTPLFLQLLALKKMCP